VLVGAYRDHSFDPNKKTNLKHGGLDTGLLAICVFGATQPTALLDHPYKMIEEKLSWQKSILAVRKRK
jgi:hypothetical protein